MVWVCVLGYRRARGGEEKGMDSRKTEFNVKKGHGSMEERYFGILIAARVMWEWVLDNVEGSDRWADWSAPQCFWMEGDGC